MLRLPVSVLATLAITSGCATTGDDDDGSFAQAMTAQDIARVLDVANYPGLDQAALDDLIGLDARAARAIAQHRAGADGLFPSSDDELFDDLEELDAVPYVGNAALSRLSAYAQAHPAPAGETVEGVRFRGWEAEIVLWGANVVPVGVLDGMIDDRAAQHLVAARPFADLTAVGQVALVGPSALDRMRREARTWWYARASHPTTLAGTFDGVAFDEATAVMALEIANDHTRDAMVAGGVYAGGATAIVGNRPYASLTEVAATANVGAATMRGLHAYATSLLAAPRGTIQDGDECPSTQDCADGLICAGTSLYGHGFCRPAWMAGTFTSTATVVIPDGNLAGAASSIEVDGLASVPEDILVHLDIDHPRPAELRITLTQPSSAESLVWAVDSAGVATVMPMGTEHDSDVNGTWTLLVVDTRTGNAGVLRGWSLELTSRWD